MKIFNELQEAEIRNNFRNMYHDIGLDESSRVLAEILETAALLAEIMAEEIENAQKG